jgi:hypothetical protein
MVHGAADISNVGISFNTIIYNLSEYLNFCPISYKIRREYTKMCLRNYDYLALYDRKIYVFKSDKELKDFISNPDTFTNKGVAFIPPEEISIEDIQSVHSKF